MPKRPAKPALSGTKTLLLLLSLSFSIFLVALFVRVSLPKHESFVGPMTGLPMFERLLPAGTLIAEDSISLLPDIQRPAYAVGYSLGSQSGVALVVWDQIRERYVTTANRLFASGVSGTAAQPPKLTVESLGKGQPWIIVIRSPLSDESTGTFFALRVGNDLKFVTMMDSQGKERPAFFLTGLLPGDGGSATMELQDINSDGLSEVLLKTAYFEDGDLGSGRAMSVEVYGWRDGGFVYNSELSRILTNASGLFPEPAKP